MLLEEGRHARKLKPRGYQKPIPGVNAERLNRVL
jgi:hypothetical protein